MNINTPGHARDILIVDDTPSDLKMLMNILKEDGYMVRPANDGELAMRSVNVRLPELILLDIRMPGLNGYHVCQRLKSSEITRNIPVIFISSLGESLDKVRAFNVGGVDYITKPFEASEVLARVQTHLSICLMQKQLEEHIRQLKDERDMAQKYLDIAGVVMLVIDANQKVSLINRKGCTILGYKEEEIIGNNWFDNYLPVKHKEPFKAVFQKLMAGEVETVQNYENPVLNKKGEERIIAWHNSLLTDEQGNIIGILSSGEDVTEQKKSEEVLRAANERLLELDSMKSMFIASMSHELRTPLNSVIGFSGLILEGLAGDISPEMKDYIKRINRSGKHLLALISNVLDISKLESGKLDVDVEHFDLFSLVEEAVDEITPKINDKQLVIKSTVPDNLEMYTDRTRLFQCVINLLSNAVKFTEAGEIRIMVEENQDQIEISVMDTGIGISDDNVQHIFSAFERLDSPLKIKAGGSGLGLYLTNNLVTEVLHGEITVESEEGKGSVFRLKVPKEIEKGDSNRTKDQE